jgi:hypothetical protein
MTALAGVSTAARADCALVVEKPAVPQGHRVPAHLARRFHQICLGVTAEILEGEGLTPTEYGVLAAVDDHPGQDQRGLAAGLGIDAASTSQIVDRLERAGLIARRVNPEDRRARAALDGERRQIAPPAAPGAPCCAAANSRQAQDSCGLL